MEIGIAIFVLIGLIMFKIYAKNNIEKDDNINDFKL